MYRMHPDSYMKDHQGFFLLFQAYEKRSLEPSEAIHSLYHRYDTNSQPYNFSET